MGRLDCAIDGVDATTARHRAASLRWLIMDGPPGFRGPAILSRTASPGGHGKMRETAVRSFVIAPRKPDPRSLIPDNP
jgi:hypothetical protein